MAYSTLVATELGTKLIEAGERLVRALDGANIDVAAAFWLLSEEDSSWKLYIASEAVDRFGARAFYKRLAPYVRNAAPLSLSYIAAVKPSDKVVSLLGRVLKTGHGGVSSLRLTRTVIDGVLIPDAYVYRAT